MIDKDSFAKDIDFHGAKGLIFIGKKIVVIRRDAKTAFFPLFLDLPGGGKEAGETPFQTLKRECFEELGLTIPKAGVVYSQKHPSVSHAAHFTFFFVIRSPKLKASDIVFGDEGTEYVLMTPEEFVERDDAIKGQKKRVQDYLSYATKKGT